MVNSPCLDCPDRTPGCHKPEACLFCMGGVSEGADGGKEYD